MTATEQPLYTGGKLLLLNVALGLGTFIQILDSSITNVAIPYIAGNLSVSADQGTWVITSFAASNAIVLPLTGWLSNYFGRVRLFVTSVLLFTFVSLLCGLASSLTILVILRVIQGAVAGCLIPLSQSLLMANNPRELQGAALGFWSMIVVVAPIAGPILGGYLTEVYSWPWIFYINVPIGLFSAFITWAMLGDRESEIIRKPIDWVGLFFLAAGVACLQVMLDKGKDLDWFDSTFIVALTVISVISIAYFVVWNYYEEYPIVDFSFFTNRNFVFGTIAITLGYLFFFGSAVTLPLWLQTKLNYTPFWAGVAVAPIGIFPVLLSAFVGMYMHRIDLRWLSTTSFFLFSITYFYQTNFTTEVSLDVIMMTRLFQGLGVAVFFIPLVQISLAEIPPDKFASASGVFNFIRILVGSGFGTSLAIELWTHRAISRGGYFAEAISPYNPEFVRLCHLFGNDAAHPTGLFARIWADIVDRQGYMLATNDLAWLAAWCFLLMMPLPFLCKRPKVGTTVFAGSH